MNHCERDSVNPAKNSLKIVWYTSCPVDQRLFSHQSGQVIDAIRKRYFSQPSFLQLNFLTWCAIAAVLFWIRFVIYKDLTRALTVTLGADTLGFLLTCGLRYFYRRKTLSLPLDIGFLLQVALLSLLGATIQAESVQVLADLLNWQGVNRSHGERLLLFSAGHWILYLGWSVGYFWIKAERHARQKSVYAASARADATKAELQLLRFQLDPHFLFNTLNGIAIEIPSNPNAAVQMVSELSSYLRYSLQHRRQLLTPLSAELDSTTAYLKIQIAGFGDRLQSSIVASTAAREVLVPSFLLQPLVENAFKHGFSNTQAVWNLDISAEVNADRLKIEIRNTGNLAVQAEGERKGMGIELIRQRLEIHYPGRHEFQIQQSNGWVVASLELEGLPCSA